MDEKICYLNNHPEIQQVVLVMEGNYEYPEIRKFLTSIAVKKVVFTGTIQPRDVEDMMTSYSREKCYGIIPENHEFEYIRLEEFQGLEGEWALCFERGPSALLLQMSRFQPKYVLASLSEGYITAFKIWETYREISDYIQVKTWRREKEPQVLSWEKKKSNGVELSVIFPMYNVEKYLDQCIESVTAWKAPYVEFLFVNDGSPDHSRDVVLKWAEKDSRIKLLDKPNGGCASARQYGLERAKGTYIGFIDPDDFIDESMFRKLLREAMTGSYEISYCGYNEYYENTGEMKRVDESSLDWPYDHGTSDPRRIRELIVLARVAIWRGIYKAEMLHRNGIHFYTDLRRFDDLPFKVETFAAAKSVIAVPENLYYYRLARPGQDVSADDERLYVHFDIFDYLNQSICKTKDARLIDHLQMCKINTHLWAIGKIKPEFRKTYVERAKADLEITGRKGRTYEIAKKRIGQVFADYYLAIVEENLTQLEHMD